MDLWDLFVGFLRASNLGFGGGPAIIPLVQAEAVDQYGWMTSSQFSEVVAVTNALPGPIISKLAAYTGYQVAWWPGVFVALLAANLPTILLVVLAGGLMSKYTNSPGLQSMLKGVRPVITVLIAVVALGWLADIVSAGQGSGDWWLIAGSLLIGAGACAGLYFKVHPALLVVMSLVLGYLMF
jgi:chromate transporter